MRMSRTVEKIKLATRLGWLNIVVVLIYRLRKKFGLFPQKSSVEFYNGPTFLAKNVTGLKGTKSLSGRQDWLEGTSWAFGLPTQKTDNSPPDWLLNFKDDTRPWFKIPDFDDQQVDIKIIWEPSRFDWLIPLCQRYLNGSSGELDRINDWIDSWIKNNPAFLGPNWKCGQEASIRLMNLVCASVLLEEYNQPSKKLTSLVSLHLSRIQSTIGYAMAQNNNHGVSEAAALFIGGTFLGNKRSIRIASIGRKLLADRAEKLVLNDGGFSQYSVNYHRMMLDIYCFAEVWRRRKALPPFAEETLSKLKCAVAWLENLTDDNTGAAPMIGANDGARLFAFSPCEYNDMRPTVYAASILFARQQAYRPGPWDEQLTWVLPNTLTDTAPILNKYDRSQPKQTFLSLDFGLIKQETKNCRLFLKFPIYRYRPSQSDALHCDFWVDGVNILRDAGSFQYKSTKRWQDYFSGPAGHNTVEFDRRQQMRRVGRFLFLDWLKTDTFIFDYDHQNSAFEVGYTDNWGCSHRRKCLLDERTLTVTDSIEGPFQKAILRWRLAPQQLYLNGYTIKGESVNLEVRPSIKPKRIEVLSGYESIFYSRKSQLPVLEVEFDDTAVIETVFNF